MFKKIWAYLVAFWGKLPKEVKVAAFIATSYGLADVISALELIQVSNTWLAIILNLFLVFLKELKPRVERYKANP
jgi:hypothetical protein